MSQGNKRNDEVKDTTGNPIKPDYYKIFKGKNIEEVLDMIEVIVESNPNYAEHHIEFHIGNTFKYLPRAGIKDSEAFLKDLKKSKFYLDRAIAKVEANIKNQK